MAKNNEVTTPEFNKIVAGTIIAGEIKANGDIRIDGTVTGSVTVHGKIVVGNTGRVEGEIICQNADISGNLKVKITVAELLYLKSTAKIEGDINTNKLAIDPGAIFTGTCCMGTPIKDINNVNHKEAKQVQVEERTA